MKEIAICQWRVSEEVICTYITLAQECLTTEFYFTVIPYDMQAALLCRLPSHQMIGASGRVTCVHRCSRLTNGLLTIPFNIMYMMD